MEAGTRLGRYEFLSVIFINHWGQRKAKRIGDRETALRIAARIRERIASEAISS